MHIACPSGGDGVEGQMSVPHRLLSGTQAEGASSLGSHLWLLRVPPEIMLTTCAHTSLAKQGRGARW